MGKEETIEVLEPEVKVEDKTDNQLNPRIILYNDNHNSFDYVIMCLMAYCEHDMIQAEQCAWIVHTKGKCAIKHGPLEKLLVINEALSNRDLTTDIEF